MSTPWNRVPENYVCPKCEQETLETIVDGSYHVRWGTFQSDEPFKEGAPPEQQPVRLYCETCDCCLPITAELAESLTREAGAE